MKSPFFKVDIINSKGKSTDITEKISSFVYEDSIEEDSMIKLNIIADFAKDLADDANFSMGSVLHFQFGYLQGQISKVHKARITDISHSYGDTITMSVTALDIGNVIKKATSTRIWKKKTSSDIAKEIADSWGMGFVTDATSKVWDSLPQGNKTDKQLLSYLAERETDGDYIHFIRNNTLYFVKRGLDSKSAYTYTYGQDIINFKTSFKESSAQPTAAKAKVVVNNPKIGGHSVQSASPKTEKGGAYTGKYKNVYQIGGKKVGKVPIEQTDKEEKATKKGFGKPIIDPTPSKIEASNLANSKKKKATLKTLVADLQIEGNPSIEPNTIITINNVAKAHAGNWYVIKITHSLTTGGYTCKLDLSRNAGKKKSDTEAKPTKVNTSIGIKPSAQKSENTVKVYEKRNVYRADGSGKVIGTKKVEKK